MPRNAFLFRYPRAPTVPSPFTSSFVLAFPRVPGNALPQCGDKVPALTTSA